MKQKTASVNSTEKKAAKSTRKAKKTPIVKKSTFRADVNFIPTTSAHNGQVTSVFLNKLNEEQKEYIIELIQKRIERDRIKSEYVVAALAEALDYRVYNAQHVGKLFLELSATLLYNKSIFEPQFGKYNFKDLIKYLKSISSFLSFREENYDGVLFDYWKVLNTSDMDMSAAIEFQKEHIERRQVDDGVWLFDMQFKVPFNKLSEEEKVDRVKVFFESWIDWHGDTDQKEDYIPAHVSKYIPKAMALINKSGNP